jgi:hypothetical protein
MKKICDQNVAKVKKKKSFKTLCLFEKSPNPHPKKNQ